VDGGQKRRHLPLVEKKQTVQGSSTRRVQHFALVLVVVGGRTDVVDDHSVKLQSLGQIGGDDDVAPGKRVIVLGKQRNRAPCVHGGIYGLALDGCFADDGDGFAARSVQCIDPLYDGVNELRRACGIGAAGVGRIGGIGGVA